MKALPIILVAAGAGVAYVVWRRTSAPPPPIVDPDDKDAAGAGLAQTACDYARKAAALAAEKEQPGSGSIAGEAAYLACKLVEAPLHNSNTDNARRVAEQDAKNTALNGATELAASVAGLQ